MKDFFQRLFVACIAAVLTVIYALLLALLISLVQFPAQVVRTLATLILNLCTYALHYLEKFMRAVNPE